MNVNMDHNDRFMLIVVTLFVFIVIMTMFTQPIHTDISKLMDQSVRSFRM